MALPLPSSLSPSKVSSFQSCALAFRFSSIDKLPETPSEPAVKGTTVHRALELFMQAKPEDRLPELAAEHLQTALEEMEDDPDFQSLELSDAESAKFTKDTQRMLDRYFTLEDPRQVDVVSTEQMLEADVGDVHIRGIIDRLERDADGHLIVSDYKTGRAPSVMQERSRLGGVHFYAYLCKEIYGELPKSVQLIYLGSEPQVISATPTEQSVRGLERKLAAMWTAVERACEREDFRPKQSALCNWCSFKEYCPAFGGDPAKAAELAKVVNPTTEASTVVESTAVPSTT